MNVLAIMVVFKKPISVNKVGELAHKRNGVEFMSKQQNKEIVYPIWDFEGDK